MVPAAKMRAAETVASAKMSMTETVTAAEMATSEMTAAKVAATPKMAAATEVTAAAVTTAASVTSAAASAERRAGQHGHKHNHDYSDRRFHHGTPHCAPAPARDLLACFLRANRTPAIGRLSLENALDRMTPMGTQKFPRVRCKRERLGSGAKAMQAGTMTLNLTIDTKQWRQDRTCGESYCTSKTELNAITSRRAAARSCRG